MRWTTCSSISRRSPGVKKRPVRGNVTEIGYYWLHADLRSRAAIVLHHGLAALPARSHSGPAFAPARGSRFPDLRCTGRPCFLESTGGHLRTLHRGRLSKEWLGSGQSRFLPPVFSPDRLP